jgi:hypothetical protein
MNNLSGSDPGLAPTYDFVGLMVVNGATSRGGTAIQIGRNGAHSNNEWNRGIWIKDVLSTTGRGMEFKDCGSATRIAVDNVLKIQSIDDAASTSCLALVPYDDDAAAIFFTTNAADDAVTSVLMKRGAWHLGGPHASLDGMLNIKQNADAEDTITLQRFTDSTPTGDFLALRNAANDTNLGQIGVDGRYYIQVPDSAVTDGDLSASQVSIYLDESGNDLLFRVKYANGSTMKLGTVALV